MVTKTTIIRSPLDIAHQKGYHNIVSLLFACFRQDNHQESLAGSVESGYVTGMLSTNRSSSADSESLQM